MHTRPLPDASPSIQGIGLNQLLDVPSLGVLQVVLLEVGQSFLGFCEVAWPILLGPVLNDQTLLVLAPSLGIGTATGSDVGSGIALRSPRHGTDDE